MIKYNTWWKEQSKKWQEDAFRTEDWGYNKKDRHYACPDWRKLTYRETKKEKNPSGYQQTIGQYECESCKYSRLKKQCANGKGNCGIERNGRLLRVKRKARRILEDERYKSLRKQRSAEVGTVFGQINVNRSKRFV